ACYAIVRGRVKIQRSTSDGTPRILRIAGAGEVFGEFSMLDGCARSATALAIEECDVLKVSRLQFQEFVSDRSPILWKVIEDLCDKLRRQNEMTESLISRDPSYRLLNALWELGVQHGEETPDGRRIQVRLSMRELAAMVGLERSEASH